jgi:DNA polymerase III subunit alpha
VNSYACLRSHTYYSLQESLCSPENLTSKTVEYQIPAIAITDHGNLAGVVQHVKTLKNTCICTHGKNIHSASGCFKKGCSCTKFESAKVKPILGCEFYITPQDAAIKNTANYNTGNLVILSKNSVGWKQLIAATSESNKPEIYDLVPRLDIDRLSAFSDGNLIALTGIPGSVVSNAIFTDVRKAYMSHTVEEAKAYTSGWVDRVTAILKQYEEIFGRESLYIEIFNMASEDIPAFKLIAEGMRYIAKKLNLRAVACPNIYYPSPDSVQDHRILQCSRLNKSRSDVEKSIYTYRDLNVSGFFRSDKFYIPSGEELSKYHTETELKNTFLVADQCEEYNILCKPQIPQFPCPNNLTADQYMRQLCLEGWKNKVQNIIPQDQLSTYAERVKKELAVLQKAGLSDYFLIVQDYIGWAKNNNILCGGGRGSSAGCLVAYLLGITGVDSVKYDLWFERFYNEGRNSADHVELPDIDTDFEAERRDRVINYIREKYGREHVCQMATYNRIQGRKALRLVLKARGGYSEDFIKKLTVLLPPDENKIAGELQSMREDTGEASLIEWSIRNNKKLSEHVQYNKDDELIGDLSPIFAQAMELEGVRDVRGKHASGLVISKLNLYHNFPMVLDTDTKELIVGVAMEDAFSVGLAKYDLLSLASLSRIRGIQDIIRYGKIQKS